MNKLCKERAVLRSLFTKSTNKLEELLKVSDLNISSVYGQFELALKRSQKLLEIEEKVKEEWLARGDVDWGKFEENCEKADEYELRWAILRKQYEQKIFSVENGSQAENNSKSNIHNTHTKNKPSNVHDTDSSGSTDNKVNKKFSKRKFRLPKIELRKFDGQVKNWLTFWVQFKKIDEDEFMDDEDKFQYLIQATEPGSNARELVESFPPSGPNYHKAVMQLKGRFAREDLMVENYVRELLNLVLLQNKTKLMSLRPLYDKMLTQLRALETLGVTNDKYAAMLYPLVESAIPEEVLRTWERTRPAESKEMLTRFLDFLRKEVENEERIQIAKYNFMEESLPNTNTKEATANCLVSGEMMKGKNEKLIPHHAVIKGNSLTTRIILVFDASAKDKNRMSINMCLQKGQTLVEVFSRGCNPKVLLETRWWEGHDWLRMPASKWPKSDVQIDDIEVSKEKKDIVIAD